MRFRRDRNGTVRPRGRAQFNLRGRLRLVAGVLGACGVVLVARAVDLQLADNAYYQQKADARFLREIPIPTSRGMITDRNGEPLAVSSPVDSVWGNPQELLKAPDRLPELAEALDVPLEHLERRLAQRADKEFVYLKRRINPSEAQQLLARRIPGVFSQREFRRFYPQGEALAHVLGFTNIDDAGQEGVELAFDEWLRGTPGAQKVIRDRRGRIVENVDLVRPAQPGKDLTLSIDRRIQYLAHRELRATLQRTGASAGSAVVLDIATGEILAMATLPTFNPNAVTGEHRDPRNLGVLDTTGVITKSSNIGTSMIVQKLDNRYFHDFLARMGYGRSTGSGFPGEASGLLLPADRWSGTHKQTMSYGYGLSATPLQIARSYATIANHGRAVQPTLVKGQQGESQQVMSPEIADTVLRMMQTVTEPGGTAVQAAIPGYHVAGKTGTARKASGGGYSRRYVSFFAGVVPVETPRFAMAVVIDDPDPAKGIYGGQVSAPVFQRVMDGALRLMDVPPDDIETWLAEQARQQAKERTRTATRTAAGPAGGAP